MTDSALITVAVPCRADEPDLGGTLRRAHQSWLAAPQAGTHALELLVCLNGGRPDRPLAALRAFAAGAGFAMVEVPADAPGDAATLGAQATAVALLCARAGKPIAWNVLRRHARGRLMLFLDADVMFAPETFGLLLGALAGRPDAAIASGRTRCAPRPGFFERVMATPYAVDFPNLSPQLYAARVSELPLAIPEDLLDPEHWLELTLGHERIVRVPDAHVTVRLPATVGDFFRQRIRIEIGKVQQAREYPGLARRGAPQPGSRAVVAALGPTGTARLIVYVALRSVAHLVAWWRYRRGRRGNLWPQPSTTKEWGAT